MKQHHWLSIILIAVCGMMLTACEIDNTEKTDEHYAVVKDSSWQLSHIYVNNEWMTPAVYADFNIQSLQFMGNDKFQITVYNHDGQKGTHTFNGNYKIADGSIYFSNYNQGNVSPLLFSLNIISIDNTSIEGGFTIYEDETVKQNGDGSTTFTPNTHSYRIRLTRK